MLYQLGIKTSFRLDVPVIVVGNLTVGGTGKTPLVIALAKWLATEGYKPGIITRGYGGQSLQWPLSVTADSDPWQAGDEAVVLARRSGVDVVAGPDRVRDGQMLIDKFGCDVIISDDGFQHFRLQRDVDIVVVDGEQKFGNGWCLPAGPLRETSSGIRRADLVVSTRSTLVDAYSVNPEISKAVSMNDNKHEVLLEDFAGKTVHAIAAIGNPERFFSNLEDYGIIIKRHIYPDHYLFCQADIENIGTPLLMTEKDAVKCEQLDLPADSWFVPLTMRLQETFTSALKELL